MQKQEKSLKEQYIEMQQKAFIREVNEDVRTQKLLEIWNKFKYYIIATIVIVLSFTIINNMYEANKKEVSLEQAKVFERIISNPTVSTDGKILELSNFAKTAKYGYRDIAYFNIYSLQIENKKVSDAIKTLKTLIDNATDKSFKNLAILKLATLNYSQKEITEADKTEIIKMLSKISASNPLYFSAQYVLGTIYISENNLNLAKTTFERIVEDEKAPVGIKSQGISMLNFIKSKTAK